MDDGAEAIFSIHISRTLSAILESAQIAAEQFKGIPVYPIDSGNLSMALGLIVVEAAKAAKEGKTIQDIQEIINAAIQRAYAYAKLDTIDYLLRGGRINSIQHSVISLLGIKPILKMHEHISKMEIARTRSKAFEKVMQRALEVRPRSEYFGITHANVPDQADELIQHLQEHYPDLPKPWVTEVNPALGFHVGPGALCINWIEKEGLDEEPKKGFKSMAALEFLQLHAITGLWILGLMSTLWIISLLLKDTSIVDIFWGAGLSFPPGLPSFPHSTAWGPVIGSL